MRLNYLQRFTHRAKNERGRGREIEREGGEREREREGERERGRERERERERGEQSEQSYYKFNFYLNSDNVVSSLNGIIDLPRIGSPVLPVVVLSPMNS
jgi:hypothetical protein